MLFFFLLPYKWRHYNCLCANVVKTVFRVDKTPQRFKAWFRLVQNYKAGAALACYCQNYRCQRYGNNCLDDVTRDNYPNGILIILKQFT